MYGSSKSEHLQPYKLTEIYNHDLNQFIEFLVPEFEGRLISWGEGSTPYSNAQFGGVSQ
jgi:hypothetical protein